MYPMTIPLLLANGLVGAVKLFYVSIVITKTVDSYNFMMQFTELCIQRFCFHNGMHVHVLGIFRISYGKKMLSNTIWCFCHIDFCFHNEHSYDTNGGIR